jgi:hypothetical protein
MISVALALAAILAAPGPALADLAPATLQLDRLYAATPAGNRIAPEVEALAGHRVRLVGFMVHMEEPPRAAFYVTTRPIDADESGGGTGDLPPGAARVEVPWLEGEVPFVRGPIEVVGVLQVERAEDDAGRVSWIRVVMEAPPSARTTGVKNPLRPGAVP